MVNGRDSGKKQALGESKEAIVLLIHGSDEHVRKYTIDLAAILTQSSREEYDVINGPKIVER